MSLLKRFNETKAFQKFTEGLTKINESAIAQNVHPGSGEAPNQGNPNGNILDGVGTGNSYGRIEDQTNQVPPGNNLTINKKTEKGTFADIVPESLKPL